MPRWLFCSAHSFVLARTPWTTFSCLALSCLLAVNKEHVHYSGVEVAVALLLRLACAHIAAPYRLLGIMSYVGSVLLSDACSSFCMQH